MAFHDTFIPIVAILLSVAVPFILLALQQATKRSDTNSSKISEIYEKISRIYETLNQVGGDIKLHTNQISAMQIDISKIEDRLRQAEGDIIRTKPDRGRSRRRQGEE